jgi:hypothetical protein
LGAVLLVTDYLGYRRNIEFPELFRTHSPYAAAAVVIACYFGITIFAKRETASIFNSEMSIERLPTRLCSPDRLKPLALFPIRMLGSAWRWRANAEMGTRPVARPARDFPREHEPCPIGTDRALNNALITAPDARDPDLLKKLDAVAGRILYS